ncbi:signal recognition particle, SRP19 subunit [Rickenella mellea]|uniref:Signal recognition particle, SRP19 subunit n=1 Tax=Rickenella mellea TaxID=50990 RepID=A0A4Y7PX32_9AGAM|nr:signal recognition particle, SRP19 subunit [Rickenella mellea]
MSRRAAIIEEFDDDTDLPLPTHPPLPNLGERGALLEAVEDDDDAGVEDSDDDNAMNFPSFSSSGPTAGPASPSLNQPGSRDAPPSVSDITPYKNWTCIYPIYIDAKRSFGTGSRRVARTKAVWWPLSKDIADATSRLGLSTLHEVQKCHPSDWENPGRVRVQWKKDGRLVNPRIKTKKQLLEAVGFHIQSTKPELIPKEPFTFPTPPDRPPPSKSSSAGKGKQASKSKTSSAAKSQAPARCQMPIPPEPHPTFASRVSPYSPALQTGVLIDTVKAGMSAADGPAAPGQVGGAGAGGKGKRKVVRVRG